jgi:glycosyltransferase involved in cell wall biosynthesis
MKVLLDLRCLETESGRRGIGRYTREIAEALRGEGGDELSLAGLSWSGTARGLGLEDVRYPGPRRGIRFLDRFLLPRLFRRHGIDLYHSPAYPLPRGMRDGRSPRPALVLTIHDLVADIHPLALAPRHRRAFRQLFASAAAADRVVTVSETTRRELLARYPVEGARVVAIPNGVSEAFGTAAASAPSSGLPRPFLLYVGGLDPLKNVPFLLQVLALARGREPDLSLVVAGEEGARARGLAERARAAGLGSAVRVVGHLDDATLSAAYREAAAFVFPSRYEGFGLPPLEAMAAGCPVVSSPGGALREVLEGAAPLVDPDDAAAWADQVTAMTRDPAARRRWIEAGRERAGAFTWSRAGRSTLAVYREANDQARRG